MSEDGTHEGNWAKPVETLTAGEAPAGARQSRRGQAARRPVQGFGKLWQKTYKVGSTASRRRRRR